MKFVFVASIFLHNSVLGENEVGAVRRHNQYHLQGQTALSDPGVGANDLDSARGVNSKDPEHAGANSANRNLGDNSGNETGTHSQPDVHSHELRAHQDESDRETDISGRTKSHTPARAALGEGDSDNEKNADKERVGDDDRGSSSEEVAEDARARLDVQSHESENDANSAIGVHRIRASEPESTDVSKEDPDSVEVFRHDQEEFGEDEDPEQRFAARPARNSSAIQMSAGENAICQGSDEVKVTVSKVEGTSSTKEVSISVTWKDADFDAETGKLKTSDWSKNYDTGSITKSTHILVEIKKGKQAKKFDYEIGELLAGKDDWTKKEKLTPNGHINLEFECLEKRPERCERNGQCPWNESCSDSNECEADKTDWRPRSGASMMVNYLALALSMI